MKKFAKLVASLALPFLAAAIGNLATTPNISTWYAALEKPLLNPPNAIFGPVWSVLYLLMGVSLYLVWTAAGTHKTAAYVAFGVQLVLNTLWSIVFFGLHLPWLGVAVIILLLLAILTTIWQFRQYSRWAAWLLVPYVCWVSFATYLTVGIAILN